MGSYEQITQEGFNSDEILQSYSKAAVQGSADQLIIQNIEKSLQIKSKEEIELQKQLKR